MKLDLRIVCIPGMHACSTCTTSETCETSGRSSSGGTRTHVTIVPESVRCLPPPPLCQRKLHRNAQCTYKAQTKHKKKFNAFCILQRRMFPSPFFFPTPLHIINVYLFVVQRIQARIHSLQAWSEVHSNISIKSLILVQKNEYYQKKNIYYKRS